MTAIRRRTSWLSSIFIAALIGWSSACTRVEPDVVRGLRVFEQLGEYVHAAEGQFLELVVGEGCCGPALVFEFSAEAGVIHPTLEGGSGYLRGAGAFTLGSSGEDMRHREFLFLGELRAGGFKSWTQLASVGLIHS